MIISYSSLLNCGMIILSWCYNHSHQSSSSLGNCQYNENFYIDVSEGDLVFTDETHNTAKALLEMFKTASPEELSKFL